MSDDDHAHAPHTLLMLRSIGRVAERWLPGVAGRLQYYVYLLIDPETRRPFYVGKGVGSRCFAHLEAARCTDANQVGDYEKLATIRRIEAAGHRVRIDILRHGLTEAAALEIECTAIDVLGLGQLTNRVAGHGSQRTSVDDINAQLGARPAKFEAEHRIVLIRIARHLPSEMDPVALYEATRKWWRIGDRRRRIGDPLAPDWALAVYAGVVRAAFRIEQWLPVGATEVAEDPKRKGRWCFVGSRDDAMEKLYVPTDVTAELPRSAQNPLRFVNCR